MTWGVGRDLVAPPRRRRHGRLARGGDAGPGRRLPPLRQGGDPGDPHGARRGLRAAVGARSHRCRPAPPARRGARRCCAGRAAALPTCCARTSITTPCSAPPRSTGRWCGASRRRRRAPVSAHSAPAMRHVGHVGRPIGGSGEVPRTLLASFEAAGGILRTQEPGRLDPVRRRAGAAASGWSTARNSSRRSSCRRATRTTPSCGG